MKPLINPIGTDDGQFHGGNQLTGEKGTIVTPDWLNDYQAATRSLQNEIISILTDRGITPNESSVNQLLLAINSLISNYGNTNNVPVGVPLPYPLATLPPNHLFLNGATFSTSTYPLLAAVYPSGTLPDLRGEFIRGWDNGRGVDSGRALLSAQLDAIGVSQVTSDIRYLLTVTDRRTASSDSIFGIQDGLSFADNGTSSTTRLVIRAANETRPRNIAFNYICRAK
ncbi:phage tail protein [Klebsiella pneumoniae]|uniref:phage tail protein n=1 Tax=Klebsiella pneumoniae TaxID=573 RepID=UPI002E19BAB4|nr:tail fiber protein [Klebsiella pneumoniae]